MLSEIETECFKHVKNASKALDKNELETAVEEYELAFRRRQFLSSRQRRNFFYFFRHPRHYYILLEERDSEEWLRPYYFILRHLKPKDKDIDTHFLRLIANNYLLFDDERSLMHLRNYIALRHQTLEQKIFAGLLFDALNQASDANNIFMEIYQGITKDPSSVREIIPTLKGKIYSIESRDLLKSLFLFKESNDYDSLRFESDCSSMIESVFKYEPSFHVSKIRNPIDTEDGKYVSLIKRERCISLSDVPKSKENVFLEVLKCLSTIHSGLEVEGLEKRPFFARLDSMGYSDEAKGILLSCKPAFEDCLKYVPFAFHKDAHPSNFGVMENNGIVVFDCENKGSRPVTEDLAKLIALSSLGNMFTADALKYYEINYNLNFDEKHKHVSSLHLPFLNATIELAFSYHSSMPYSHPRKKEITKKLQGSAVSSLQQVKENFHGYYSKHTSSYSRIESLLDNLLVS